MLQKHAASGYLIRRRNQHTEALTFAIFMAFKTREDLWDHLVCPPV